MVNLSLASSPLLPQKTSCKHESITRNFNSICDNLRDHLRYVELCAERWLGVT
jgi:hypothetical protein